MSVIRTYKCDGCGAITRSYPDDWFELAAERMAKSNRKGFFEFASRTSVKRHICSVECAALAITAAREEIEALEIPA